MKRKIISVLCLLAIAVSAGCSKAPEEKDINNYIGDGMMTNIQLLIESNENLTGNVFKYAHLPVDKNVKAEKDGKTYYAVTSDDYSSFEEIKQSVYSTYTDSAAEKLLSDCNYYTDIDGKLYFDSSMEFEKAEPAVWNIEKIQVKSVSDNEYILSVPFTLGRKTVNAEITVSREGGNLRLAEVYPR